MFAIDRPYIICHMTTSIDGKVTGDFLGMPESEQATEVYYEINRAYHGDAFACGRITMEGSFTGGWYPNLAPFADADIPKEDHVADPDARFFAVAFDRRGRLGWKASRIEDEDPGYDDSHIIEVLCEDTPVPYLAYLRSIGVSYIFAGQTDMDLPLALSKLKSLFGIERLLLEGGSVLNGAFQREGVIDELSLVVAPVAAQADGLPLFDGGTMESYTLAKIENHNGVLWLNYKKAGVKCSRTDCQKLAAACETMFDISSLSLSDAYYYSSLPQCIIDAVFSIGVKYTSTQNTVLRYCKKYGLRPYDRNRTCGCHTVSEFLANLERVGVQQSASTIFENHQRTSATNGILKSEAVYHFAKILQQQGIETFDDFNAKDDLSHIAKQIKQLPGQHSGLSWQYFCMLAGDDSLAKPDRHILRFMENTLGRKPSIAEAQQLMTDTVAILKQDHPNITVRLLDYSIWDAYAHKK